MSKNNNQKSNLKGNLYYHGSKVNIPDGEKIKLSNGQICLTKDVRYALWRCGNFDIYKDAEKLGYIKNSWKYGFKEDYKGENNEFTVVELNNGAFFDIFSRGHGMLEDYIYECDRQKLCGQAEYEFVYDSKNRVVGSYEKNSGYIYMCYMNEDDEKNCSMSVTVEVNNDTKNSRTIEYNAREEIKWDKKVEVKDIRESVNWLFQNYWKDMKRKADESEDNKNNTINEVNDNTINEVNDNADDEEFYHKNDNWEDDWKGVKIDKKYKIHFIEYQSEEWWRYWNNVNRGYVGYMNRRKERKEEMEKIGREC